VTYLTYTDILGKLLKDTSNTD